MSVSTLFHQLKLQYQGLPICRLTGIYNSDKNPVYGQCVEQSGIRPDKEGMRLVITEYLSLLL